MSQHPSWLTENYLEGVLKHHLNVSDLKIVDFQVSPGNKPGEGFFSILLRAFVAYAINSKTSSLRLILKIELDDDEGDLGTKEMKFFNAIAPKMLKVFATLDDNAKVIPDVIFVDQSQGVIIMEDLRVLNYTVANRLLGLDEKHAKIALQKIAKFHAASLKILEENPNAFEGFDAGVIDRSLKIKNEAYELGFKAAINEISTWEGFEEIATKMENLRGSFMERTFKTVDVNEKDFNVLNHGDAWTTNFMFTYEGGEVKDGVLLDFQLSHYSSATLDLIRFFFTSLNDDLFTPEKTDELLRFYYHELNEIVEKLKIKDEKFPSVDEFVAEYYKKMFYALLTLTTSFPIMTGDDPDNLPEVFYADNEISKAYRARVIKVPRYQLACRRFLPHMNSLGVLEL